MLPVYLYHLAKMPSFHFKFLIVGLCGSLIPSFLFAIAQTRINSSFAGILNSLTPVIAFSIGIIAFGKKGSKKQVWGLALGLIGSILLGLVNSEGELGGFNMYVLLVLLATVCYGLNVNLIESWFKDVKPVHLTSASLVYSSVPAFVILFITGMPSLTESQMNMAPLAAAVFLGVMGTAIALLLFNRLLQLTSAVEASLVTYLIPVVAVIIGVWSGEKLFLWHYLGMAVILLGVYIINMERFRK